MRFHRSNALLTGPPGMKVARNKQHAVMHAPAFTYNIANTHLALI